MIGLDTNVLLRYLVEDDPIQTRQAARVLEEAVRRNERLFVSILVLCETVWVLDRSYRQPRPAVAKVIETLLNTEWLVIERTAVVRRSLELFLAGKADFADYLIGEMAREEGCDLVYTFDRALRGQGPFQVL